MPRSRSSPTSDQTHRSPAWNTVRDSALVGFLASTCALGFFWEDLRGRALPLLGLLVLLGLLLVGALIARREVA